MATNVAKAPDWERHKNTIYRLYIKDDISLKDLIEQIRIRGLSVSKSQLESKLKEWGFRKNLNAAGWKYVAHRIEKRKEQGKKSQVILSGRRMRPKEVSKALGRFTLSQIDEFTRTCRAQTPEDLNVQILSPAHVWPHSLPWLQFQLRFPFFHAYNTSSLSADAFKGTMSMLQLSDPDGSFCNAEDHFTQKVSQTMPELEPGDNNAYYHLITSGFAADILRAAVKLVIFRLSNNLYDDREDSDWTFMTNVIRATGILQMKTRIDFAAVGDVTLSAFAETLLKRAINHLADKTSFSASSDELILEIISWLLKSGISPDLQGPDDGYIVVVQAVPRTCIGRWYSLPKSYPLIHIAAAAGSLNVVRLLLDHGADTSYSLPNFPWPTLTDTVFCAAARSPRNSIQILDCLLQHGADTTSPNDILCSAALAGNHETIEFLASSICKEHKLPPESLHDKISPLSAAAHSAETCALLLDLGLCTLNRASGGVFNPLHLAVIFGSDETVKLLLDKGADPEEVCETQQRDAYRPNIFTFVDNHLDKPTGMVKALDLIVLKHCYFTERLTWTGKLKCAQLLISAGGTFNDLHKALEIAFKTHDIPEDLLKVLLMSWFKLNGDSHSKSELSHLFDTLPSDFFYASAWLNGQNSARANLLLDFQVKPTEKAMVGAAFCGHHVLFHWLIERLPITPQHREATTYRQNWTLLEAALLGRSYAIVSTVLNAATWEYNGQILAAATAWAIEAQGDKGLLELLLYILESRPGTKVPCKYEGAAVAMAAISKSDHVLDLFMKLLPPARFAYLPTEILFPSTLSFEIEYTTVDLDLKVSKYTAFQEDLQRPRIPTYLASEYSSWRSYLWNDRIIGSPVIGAIVLNNEHGVQRLLDRGYKVDRTCLYIAVMINSLSMVKLILCALNSIKGIQANEEIREHGQSRIYDIIQIGFNPINWAVRANNKKMVQLLLQAGERIDRDFYDTREAKFDRLSPLQTAVTMRNIDLVAWLIGCGADVNGPPCPYAGSTAISVAAAHGDLAIARLLVENGTRVNTLRSQFCGLTALQAAAKNGRIDMIQLLLSHGFKSTGPYRREYLTAFEYAQQGGHHVAANIIKAHRTWETFDLAMLENISVKFSSEGQEFANEILPDECRKVISPNEPCLCFGCYPQELGDEWSDDEDTWEDTVGDSGEDLIVLEDGVQAGSLRPWAPEHIIGDHESQGWVSSFPNFDEIDIEPGQRFPTQFLSETEASILDSATAEWDDTHVQHAANSEHPSLADGPLAEPSVPTVVDEAQHNWVVASSDQELGREGADNIESLEQDLFGPLEFNWEF